jgi:maleate cis-trans isomerase
LTGAYHTDVDLFAKEMKYLHDNGFRVLAMRDLGYDDNTNLLYLVNVPRPS